MSIYCSSRKINIPQSFPSAKQKKKVSKKKPTKKAKGCPLDDLDCHLKVTLNHVLISRNASTSHLFVHFPCLAISWLPRQSHPNWVLIKTKRGCRFFTGTPSPGLQKVKLTQSLITTQDFFKIFFLRYVIVIFFQKNIIKHKTKKRP